MNKNSNLLLNNILLILIIIIGNMSVLWALIVQQPGLAICTTILLIFTNILIKNLE